ncbi:MAG: Holliday junction resolvase RuvX [Bacteroidales bacterium]|nr:Holliday junction resolvase RuvX [Bacteroidales bacterium]MBR5670712.1 Holliday junction resolvase RuvX [Bacteroidales bacterium]
MDRIIGIDYGKKRTGIAMSDPLMMFASPVETVQTTNIIDYLKKLSQQESIVRFVVGYPMNMDNRPSEAAADVDIFLKQLKKAFPDIPVSLEDERFTSVLAHRSLIDGGVKKMARRDKAAVDKVSAALILQTFMDRKPEQA